jgi:hypothetical protein
MNRVVKDFYYSEKSFKTFKSFDNPFINEEVVCEVLIDGEWKLFTEQITKGNKALSVWNDLVYLGSSDTTKYTSAIKWHKERICK